MSIQEDTQAKADALAASREAYVSQGEAERIVNGVKGALNELFQEHLELWHGQGFHGGEPTEELKRSYELTAGIEALNDIVGDLLSVTHASDDLYLTVVNTGIGWKEYQDLKHALQLAGSRATGLQNLLIGAEKAQR